MMQSTAVRPTGKVPANAIRSGTESTSTALQTAMAAATTTAPGATPTTPQRPIASPGAASGPSLRCIDT
jgi:hypothetical protein